MGSKGGRKGIQHIAQTELINFPAASHLAAALITQGKTRAHEGAEFQPGGTGRPRLPNNTQELGLLNVLFKIDQIPV